jgi:hypothetical protein
VRSCRVVARSNRIRIGKGYRDGMWTKSFLLHFGEYVELDYEDDAGKKRRLQFTAQPGRQSRSRRVRRRSRGRKIIP